MTSQYKTKSELSEVGADGRNPLINLRDKVSPSVPNSATLKVSAGLDVVWDRLVASWATSITSWPGVMSLSSDRSTLTLSSAMVAKTIFPHEGESAAETTLSLASGSYTLSRPIYTVIMSPGSTVTVTPALTNPAVVGHASRADLFEYWQGLSGSDRASMVVVFDVSNTALTVLNVAVIQAGESLTEGRLLSQYASASALEALSVLTARDRILGYSHQEGSLTWDASGDTLDNNGSTYKLDIYDIGGRVYRLMLSDPLTVSDGDVVYATVDRDQDADTTVEYDLEVESFSTLEVDSSTITIMIRKGDVLYSTLGKGTISLGVDWSAAWPDVSQVSKSVAIVADVVSRLSENTLPGSPSLGGSYAGKSYPRAVDSSAVEDGSTLAGVTFTSVNSGMEIGTVFGFSYYGLSDTTEDADISWPPESPVGTMLGLRLVCEDGDATFIEVDYLAVSESLHVDEVIASSISVGDISDLEVYVGDNLERAERALGYARLASQTITGNSILQFAELLGSPLDESSAVIALDAVPELLGLSHVIPASSVGVRISDGAASGGFVEGAFSDGIWLYSIEKTSGATYLMRRGITSSGLSEPPTSTSLVAAAQNGRIAGAAPQDSPLFVALQTGGSEWTVTRRERTAPATATHTLVMSSTNSFYGMAVARNRLITVRLSSSTVVFSAHGTVSADQNYPDDVAVVGTQGLDATDLGDSFAPISNNHRQAVVAIPGGIVTVFPAYDSTDYKWVVASVVIAPTGNIILGPSFTFLTGEFAVSPDIKFMGAAWDGECVYVALSNYDPGDEIRVYRVTMHYDPDSGLSVYRSEIIAELDYTAVGSSPYGAPLGPTLSSDWGSSDGCLSVTDKHIILYTAESNFAVWLDKRTGAVRTATEIPLGTPVIAVNTWAGVVLGLTPTGGLPAGLTNNGVLMLADTTTPKVAIRRLDSESMRLFPHQFYQTGE